MSGVTAASAGPAGERQAEPAAGSEQRVSSLELFFDLVFVFAITQVTAFIAADPTWGGALRGLLILSVVWWAWTAYSWLTNTLDTDEGRVRVVMFVAMGAMFVVSLAIPHSFGDRAGLFAGAILFVRCAHVLLYGYAAQDAGVTAAVKRLAPFVLVAAGLLVVAATQDGAVQTGLWIAAVALDFAGPALAGMDGWTVSPAHFAERYGLIVIIALGESIAETGVATDEVALSSHVVIAALLAIVIAAALWWAYFDVVALVAERRLRAAKGLEAVRMARDSYSYIHFLLIAGIVLVALGAKKTITGVDAPLAAIPAAALCGGVALYLLGHIAFRLRNVHSINRPRLTLAIVCLALIVPAHHVDALVTIAVLAALLAGLIGYETIAYREARARIRGAPSAA